MPKHNLAHLDGLAIAGVAVGDTVVDYDGRSAVIVERRIDPDGTLRLRTDRGRHFSDTPRTAAERAARRNAAPLPAAPARPTTSTARTTARAMPGLGDPRPTLSQLRAAHG